MWETEEQGRREGKRETGGRGRGDDDGDRRTRETGG